MLLVLFLVIGEHLYTSWFVTLPTNTAVLRVCTRETLLSLQSKGNTPLLNLPAAVSSSPAVGARRRKRGRKSGVRQCVRRRGNKPPLPLIILSNVRLLRSKMDELRLHTRFGHEYWEANILVFAGGGFLRASQHLEPIMRLRLGSPEEEDSVCM